jgi:hypothetical protein
MSFSLRLPRSFCKQPSSPLRLYVALRWLNWYSSHLRSASTERLECSNAPTFTVLGVQLVFGDDHGLNGIDLHNPPREVVALVGLRYAGPGDPALRMKAAV